MNGELSQINNAMPDATTNDHKVMKKDSEIKKQKMKNIKINNVVNNKSTKQSPNSNKNNNDR